MMIEKVHVTKAQLKKKKEDSRRSSDREGTMLMLMLNNLTVEIHFLPG